MIVKVIKKFRDIHTNEIHKTGDILEITKERFDEIKKSGNYVEEIKTAHLSAEDLKTWKKDELIKLAKDMGLETSGTKAELVEKISREEVEI